MNTVEEAREELDLVRQAYSTGIPGSRIDVMEAADALAQAAELKGHVAACEGTCADSYLDGKKRLCEQAQAIERLGEEQE